MDQTPVAGRDAPDHQAFGAAPPLYGEHQFDLLYSDVDPSGYRTPVPVVSSPNTPFGPHSRSVSIENLSSVRNMDSTAVDENISNLANRLSNLDGRQSPTNLRSGTETNRTEVEPRQVESRRPSDYTVRSNSTSLSEDQPSHHGSSNSPSANVSRRTSAENGTSPENSMVVPHFTEFEDISRIPSYSTAVKTPVRTPCSDDLPSYGDATLRNSSASGLPGTSGSQMPNLVHLRPGPGSRSGGNLSSLAREFNEELPRSHSHGEISNLHPNNNPGNRTLSGRTGL